MHNQKKDNNKFLKSNHNSQKIELYGNQTTKELKNKYSLRLVGEAEMGGEDAWQGGGWRTRCMRQQQMNWEVPHLHVDKLVGTVMAMGETPSLTREFFGEAHSVLEQTQTHPPKNQHQKGPIYLWVAGKVTERRSRAEQGALLPLGPSPTYSATTQLSGLPHPGE